MHILQVTLGFLPAVGWGGPVKIVYGNSKELIKRGHMVTVYCSNLLDKRTRIQPGTFERNIDGVRVVYFHTWNLPFWPGTLGPIWLPGISLHLRQEIHEFDIIHLNGYRNLMNIQVVREARKANIPIVMQPHGGMAVVTNSIRIKRAYDRWLGKREIQDIARLIVLQESEKAEALALGFPEDRIEIIHNGMEIETQPGERKQGRFREKFGIPHEKTMVLFLGRINRKKGTDMMVEAFSRISGDEKVLVIAGPDDGQLKEVQGLIRKFHLQDKVFITGLLEGEDIPSAYRDADLFVLPCRMDTFPTTIIEACSAGLPMVITEGCQSAYLVKDRVADVVPFDADRIASAIQSLLADRERYERYRVNAREVMQEEFSIQASVDKLEQIYYGIGTRNQASFN